MDDYHLYTLPVLYEIYDIDGQLVNHEEGNHQV